MEIEKEREPEWERERGREGGRKRQRKIVGVGRYASMCLASQLGISIYL